MMRPLASPSSLAELVSDFESFKHYAAASTTMPPCVAGMPQPGRSFRGFGPALATVGGDFRLDEIAEGGDAP